jgi:hypothetical protein
VKPPPGLAARELFERWLPEAWKRAGRNAAAGAPAVRVTVSGADGGDWLVATDGDSLEVTAAPAGASDRRGGEPDVWIRQNARDFLAAFTPDPDLPELLPAGWTVLDLLFLDARDVELARRIEGRFLVEVAGRRRRRWALDVAFGAAGRRAGRPRATVRLDGGTYERLARADMAPLEALLKGAVQIEGDRALAMQALILLGARLGRS